MFVFGFIVGSLVTVALTNIKSIIRFGHWLMAKNKG